MPTVGNKQSNRAPAAKRPTDQASAWDLVDCVRMLLYGQSGTGKTTFAATFPGPIRWFICSGGDKPGELRSINTPEYRKKIHPTIIRNSDDLRASLESDTGEYATTVLDHASGLADLHLREVLGIDSLPAQKQWGIAQQQQWGEVALRCKECFRALLNLPGNVVIIAQERIFGGGDEQGVADSITPTVGAALIPSVTGWLNPACDYVVQTFKRPVMIEKAVSIGGKKTVQRQRGKGVEYCLRTGPHDVMMTKFRLPKGSPLPEEIVDPDYSKVLAVIEGRYQSP